MGKFEQSVTSIEAQVCPRCLELTTELVAVRHELYEAQKRLAAIEQEQEASQ